MYAPGLSPGLAPVWENISQEPLEWPGLDLASMRSRPSLIWTSASLSDWEMSMSEHIALSVSIFRFVQNNFFKALHYFVEDILVYPWISHNFLEWHPLVPYTDQIDIFWLQERLEKIEDSEESSLWPKPLKLCGGRGQCKNIPVTGRPPGVVSPRCHTFVLLLAFLLAPSLSVSLSIADNCKNWLHISCFHYDQVKSCCPGLNRGQW